MAAPVVAGVKRAIATSPSTRPVSCGCREKINATQRQHTPAIRHVRESSVSESVCVPAEGRSPSESEEGRSSGSSELSRRESVRACDSYRLAPSLLCLALERFAESTSDPDVAEESEPSVLDGRSVAAGLNLECSESESSVPESSVSPFDRLRSWPRPSSESSAESVPAAEEAPRGRKASSESEPVGGLFKHKEPLRGKL